MATVSNTIKLGTSNTVQIGSIPDKQYAEVLITINDNELLNIRCGAGKESFVWDLGFETDNFKTIFNNYFKSTISSVTAKMTVTVFFSTGVKNLLRGDKYDVSLQLIEDINTKPIINSVVLSPVSDKGFSKYIQGKTKAKCIVDSEGQSGAEIRSVSVSIDGKNCKNTAEGLLSDWLCYSGYRNVVVTVTDSRGFKSTKTEKIYVEPYSPPIIVPLGANPSIIHGRWNPNSEKFDDSNGTQCRMLFGVYASYIEDINSSFLCSYRYKIAADNDFVDGARIEQIPFTSSSSQAGVDLLIEDGTTTDENGKITGCFGIENEYLIELTVTDSLGEKATKVFRLDVLECLWHIVGKRFSVGKYATEDELFDSAWTIHTDKNLSVGGRVEYLKEPLTVNFGGTGASTAEKARENLEITLKNLGVSGSADDLNLLSGVKTSGVTTANIKNLYGLSSNVQDQLNDKAGKTHSHDAYASSSHNHNSVYASKTHSHEVTDIATKPTTVTGTSIARLLVSGASLVGAECWATTWGKVCEIYLTFTVDESFSEGDITNKRICSIVDEYKPGRYVGLHSGGGGIVLSGEITPTGDVNIASLGSDYKAGGKISLTATYLLP